LFESRARRDRSRGTADEERRIAALLIRRADEARDRREWQRAALYYEEALRLTPRRADIHVQLGHMRKEAGEIDAAEEAYKAAQILMPDDADLALQLGHLYKLAGRLDDSRSSYQRALLLKPRWDAAVSELAQLDRAQQDPTTEEVPPEEIQLPTTTSPLADANSLLANPGAIARLVPELAPRPAHALLQNFGRTLRVAPLGREELGFWGLKPTLRGVEAIRGFVLSETPVEEVQLLLDGITFYRAALRGPYPLQKERVPSQLRKYVFNIWHDFADFTDGCHSFEIRVKDVEGETLSHHVDVMIARPLDENDFPDSDSLVGIREPDPVSLEDKIRARPSVTRSAGSRDLFAAPPRNILVLRTDQLGDMIASIAAVRRLRELFPEARLVGLLTTANAELATTLGLFDEVIAIDFPDDPIEQRRLMPLEMQEALRRQLAVHNFDIAIDLAQAQVSRDLLRLSGAAFLYGVDGDSARWLSANFSLNTHDRLNRLDCVPHSRKTLALVETLGAIARDSFEVVRRPELDRARLEKFGIAADDRYAVLHLGARIAFSRWAHFPELAALLLARTDLKVVMMTEDAAVRATLPPALLGDPRFQLIDQRLAFDDFDAFASFATVLVGNDSGPKHLAARRGTNTVTIHMARINWSEWGQEGVGKIISRRVPCAGCAVFHEPEECGKDFACLRDIRVEDVFEAVKSYV